jgi:cytoskeletal protein CcmA (bactofilin family)
MKFGTRQGETPPPTKTASSGEISAFFGEGTEIQGDLRFKQTVRVDGRIRATIRSEGELILGPKGLIEGDITVASLTVSGRIKGNLRIKDRLEIHPGGRVEGEVLLGRPGLVVHDGGIIEAKVQMGTMKEQEAVRSAEAGARAAQGEKRVEKRAPAVAGTV